MFALFSENFDGIHKSIQLDRCIKHREIWNELDEEKTAQNIQIECFPSIQHAINFIHNIKDNNSKSINVLVTGSLHLVGGALKVIKSIEYYDVNHKINEIRS